MASMPSDSTGSITNLLRQARDGDKAAEDALMKRIYGDLRKIAQSMISEQRRTAMTPDGTGLVNDACCRLLERENLTAQDRHHLFFLLGRAMRDELTEQARADLALKRGGGHRRVPLDTSVAPDHGTNHERAEIRDAIKKLRAIDPEGARVAELRFLSDLSLEETARALNMTVAIVRRHWSYAKAWLRDHMEGDGGRGDGGGGGGSGGGGRGAITPIPGAGDDSLNTSTRP